MSTFSDHRRITRALLHLVPAIAAFLLMLPRLLSPQFGLFDDGITLRTVESLTQGDFALWDAAVGRFRPAYWAYWLSIYLIFGAQPLPFFLVNTIVLGATGVLLSMAAERLSGSALLSALAGLGYVLSGPVIENYYTLSKAEPIQCLYLGGAIYGLSRWMSVPGRRPSTWSFVTVSLLLLLATGSKETALVLLPISVTWAALAFGLTRKGGQTRVWVPLAWFGAAALLSNSAYLILRTALLEKPLYGAVYAQRYVLDAQVIARSGLRWAGWILRFFPFLIPAGLLALWQGRRRMVILLASIIWMIAWIAIYLPWTFMVGYFMLPFSIGAAVFSAATVESFWRRFERRPAWRFGLGAALLGLFGFAFAVVQINSFSIARLQVAIDQANQQAVQFIAERLPHGSTLVVNIQDPNEYVDQIRVHLETLYDRPDITVVHFSPLAEPAQETRTENRYYLAPNVENQPSMTVRYGVIEDQTEAWNRSLASTLGPDAREIARFEQSEYLVDIAIPRIFCPLLSTLDFCEPQSQILTSREFRYGWVVTMPSEGQLSWLGVKAAAHTTKASTDLGHREED